MQLSIRRLALIFSSAAMLSALTLAPAQAANSVIVTTGGATSITTTSAAVYGYLDPPAAVTAYFFRYGTTSSYGQQTMPQPAPSGNSATAVQATITGLSPGTTYHLELVAVIGQGAYSSQSPGGHKTFTTSTPGGGGGGGSTKHGSLRLVGKRLKVKNGKVSIPLKCASPHACKGKLSITTSHKTKTHKRQTVSCVKSKAFAVSAGNTKTIRATVRSRCKALLGSAGSSGLGGKLTVSPSTGQPKLRVRITLISGP